MSVKDKTFVIVKEPEHLVPDQYIRSVIATANTCGGYSIQVPNDKGEPSLVTDRMDVAPTMDGVMELITRAKKYRLLLTFSKLEKVEEKFLQPYDFLMPGDITPLMSFGIEGDFPSLKEASSTEASLLSQRVILPNFGKFLKLSDGDLAKFIAEIKDPTFVDSLMARIGDRGIVCFLPPVGEAVWLGKNTLGSIFPWGQVSNTLGYKEAAPGKPDVKPSESEKKNGWWNFDKGPSLPVATQQPEPAKVQPEVPVPGPINLPAANPDTKIDAPPATPPSDGTATAGPPKGTWKTIPPGMNQKDRKKLIRRVTNCGSELPEGWEDPNYQYFEVEYPKAKAPKPADTLMAASMQKAQEAKDMRDPKGDPRPAATRGSETSAAEANAMILTKEQSDGAEAYILKVMDRQGKEIPTPLQIQQAVSKFPAFSKKFAVSYDHMLSWLPSDIEGFAKEHGKAFFHWYLETSQNWILAKQKIAELEAELAKVKPTASGQPPIIPTEQKEESKKTGTGGWSSSW